MSRRKTLRLAAITGCLWACLSLPVRADPVVLLTSGSLEYSPSGFPSGSLNFFGTDGFSLIGGTSGGNVQPDTVLQPGAVTRLSGSWEGSAVEGILTYRGQTFTNIGQVNSNNVVNVSFSSSTFTLPPAPPGPITYSVPFTLTGSFFGAPGDGINAIPTVFLDFLGTGMGSVSFLALPDFPHGFTWITGPVRLEIANTAVPEPGTLVLIGLGLAGAYGQRYRRSRQTRRTES